MHEPFLFQFEHHWLSRLRGGRHVAICYVLGFAFYLAVSPIQAASQPSQRYAAGNGPTAARIAASRVLLGAPRRGAALPGSVRVPPSTITFSLGPSTGHLSGGVTFGLQPLASTDPAWLKVDRAHRNPRASSAKGRALSIPLASRSAPYAFSFACLNFPAGKYGVFRGDWFAGKEPANFSATLAKLTKPAFDVLIVPSPQLKAAIGGGATVPSYARARLSYVLAQIERNGIHNVNWIADILGQIDKEDAFGLLNGGREYGSWAEHERMYGIYSSQHPINCRGCIPGENDLGNRVYGDGGNYAGRGMIQLTGRHNYMEWAKKTGLPLDTDPDVLLAHPEVQARMAVEGMLNGSFTGDKLADYFGPSESDGGADEAVPTRAVIRRSREMVLGHGSYDDGSMESMMQSFRGVDDGC